MNTISFYLPLAAVTLFVLAALWFFISTGNWKATPAHLSRIEMVEIHHHADSSVSSHSSSTEYRIDLLYTYEFGGKRYDGYKLFPLLPNIYSRRGDAEAILETCKANSEITVYVNPKNPARSSLLSTGRISGVTLFLYVVLVLFILGLVLFGFRYMDRIFPH